MTDIYNYVSFEDEDEAEGDDASASNDVVVNHPLGNKRSFAEI